MKINKLSLSITGLTAALLLASALPAAAATTTTSTAHVMKGEKSGASLQAIIERSKKEIDARIASLNKANTRIQGMKNVSTSTKTTIGTTITTNITALTALEAKIAADTDVATARADAATITSAFRIFALIDPQMAILASSDRSVTVANMLSEMGTKLQARITEAQAAGKDVTALTAAMTDMTAKISAALTEAQAAQTGVASLVPDKGDKTVQAANKAALLAARAHIKTATTDIQAARKDAGTIQKGLKSLAMTKKPKATTSTTSTAQ